METPRSFSYVEIDGKQVLFSELDREEQERIACFLMDQFMECFGYRREEREKK